MIIPHFYGWWSALWTKDHWTVIYLAMLYIPLNFHLSPTTVSAFTNIFLLFIMCWKKGNLPAEREVRFWIYEECEFWFQFLILVCKFLFLDITETAEAISKIKWCRNRWWIKEKHLLDCKCWPFQEKKCSTDYGFSFHNIIIPLFFFSL